MLLQVAGSGPSLPEYASQLAFVVLLGLVASAATYLVVRALLVTFVGWTMRDGRPRLGALGTTAAKAFAFLVAVSTGLGITGFGGFQVLFSLIGVGGVVVLAGVVYRFERSLASRQRS
ncbi:hypothetical protein [Haloprofundus halobius]|uniref:hypothetical protein n=1 Tax=Haloprofundus halobius TaxID=2876194 RepID=UPI001CCEBC15|nr:hypothetical protein [Haloprofundus halobius]